MRMCENINVKYFAKYFAHMKQILHIVSDASFNVDMKSIN